MDSVEMGFLGMKTWAELCLLPLPRNIRHLGKEGVRVRNDIME